MVPGVRDGSKRILAVRLLVAVLLCLAPLVVTTGEQSDVPLARAQVTGCVTRTPTPRLGVVPHLPCSDPLGPARGFNVFVFRDMNYPSGDVSGRLAVGGNATFGAFPVGDPRASPPDTQPLPADPTR